MNMANNNESVENFTASLVREYLSRKVCEPSHDISKYSSPCMTPSGTVLLFGFLICASRSH